MKSPLAAMAFVLLSLSLPARAAPGDTITACLNRCTVEKHACTQDAGPMQNLAPEYADLATAAVLENCMKAEKSCAAKCSRPLASHPAPRMP